MNSQKLRFHYLTICLYGINLHIDKSTQNIVHVFKASKHFLGSLLLLDKNINEIFLFFSNEYIYMHKTVRFGILKIACRQHRKQSN